MATFFHWAEYFSDTILWGYLGIGLILTVGTYLTIKLRFIQLRHFGKAWRTFTACCAPTTNNTEHVGIHPLKVFFASIGGCVGIGNIAVVGLAVQIGGPGALFWVLCVAFIGMAIKYAEVFLGMKFRIKTSKGMYMGGPMFFLQKAFPRYRWVAFVMAGFMCIYGVEIYMFSVIKDSISTNFNINQLYVGIALLISIFLTVYGGIQRVGTLSSILIPCFVILYLGMVGWVIMHHMENIPSLLKLIISSAFSGHAPLGGFAGSSLLLTISKGISSAAYSGDIGIGYASIIHSESRLQDPSEQASLSLLGIFIDTFLVCSATIMLLLVTNVWTEPLSGALLVQKALSYYFPYMEYFMPFFLFLLGFSTITVYLVAGGKCAEFIAGTIGKKVYYFYGFCAFILFTIVDAYNALIVMNIAGGMLMLINLSGIVRLRKDIV